MESNGDVKKSRPHLADIGNTHGQMSSDPEEDIKDIKFKLDILGLVEGALECQSVKLNAVDKQRRKKMNHALKKLTEDITKSDAHHQQAKAALKAQDDEMKKMKQDQEEKEKAKDEEMKAMEEELMKAKADLEAAYRAKEVEFRKMKADLEAANRAKEMDKALLMVKDELLEDTAARLKNSNKNLVSAATFRALWIELQRTKNERDQIEQEKNTALREKQRALAERDDAEMQLSAHLDDMGRLLRG